MGQQRLEGGQSERRGVSRAVLLFLGLLILLASGCGKSGHGAETDPEKGSDVELLNAALAQELTLLEAYTRGPASVGGSSRPLSRELRAHEQEYANAITKAIRGLGGETEAEPGELELTGIADRTDFLVFAYGLENAALASYRDVAPQLFTDAPRTLAASLAASHAQHLVLLRRALGAGALEAMPEAFESGEEPPPDAGGK